MIERPAITACVCTCDRYGLLDLAVASLAGQELPRSRYEILVVDTTEADRRARGVEGRMRRAGIRYVKAASVGLAEARNRALRQCRSPVIAFLDDDATADRHWLRSLLEGFERSAALGALGGRVQPVWENAPPAWLPSDLHGYLSVLDWGDVEIEISGKRYLAGANIAFRVSAAREVGGFRNYLGRHSGVLLSNEELEICRRLERGGFRVRYTPAAAVHHLVPAQRCTQAWMRKRIAWQAISDLMTEPRPTDSAKRLLASINAYFEQNRNASRDPELLFNDVDEPGLFAAQCSAIYAYVLLLGGEHAAATLSGTVGPSAEAMPDSHAG